MTQNNKEGGALDRLFTLVAAMVWELLKWSWSYLDELAPFILGFVILFSCPGPDLLVLALAVSAALGLVWLLHGTTRGRELRTEWAKRRERNELRQGVSRSLAAAGLPTPVRAAAQLGDAGTLVTVETPPGVADDRVLALAPVLASDLQAWGVRPTPNQSPGFARFIVQFSDPLASATQETWAPGADGLWNLDLPIPVGRVEDGTTACLGLWGQTVLVGGSPGSGKSVFGWLPLLGAALDPSAILVVVDLKPHGIETQPISERADYAAHTAAEALDLFRRVWMLIDERNAVLRAHGLEKVPSELRGSFPPVLIAVDEAAELSMSDEGKEALVLLQRIVAVGRASGISVLLMTQKPDAATIPSGLRDLFAQRVSFRVGNRHQAETILGVVSEGVRPWDIAAETPGVGYLVGLDGRPQRFRSTFLTRAEVTSIAATAAGGRDAWKRSYPQALMSLPPRAVAPSTSKTLTPGSPQRRRRK